MKVGPVTNYDPALAMLYFARMAHALCHESLKHASVTNLSYTGPACRLTKAIGLELAFYAC